MLIKLLISSTYLLSLGLISPSSFICVQGEEHGMITASRSMKKNKKNKKLKVMTAPLLGLNITTVTKELCDALKGTHLENAPYCSSPCEQTSPVGIDPCTLAHVDLSLKYNLEVLDTAGRSDLLTKSIASESPDAVVVTTQLLYRSDPIDFNNLSNFPTTVKYDLLNRTLTTLADQGLHYESVITMKYSDGIPGYGMFPGCDFNFTTNECNDVPHWHRFTIFDAMLVKSDIQTTNATTLHITPTNIRTVFNVLVYSYALSVKAYLNGQYYDLVMAFASGRSYSDFTNNFVNTIQDIANKTDSGGNNPVLILGCAGIDAENSTKATAFLSELGLEDVGAKKSNCCQELSGKSYADIRYSFIYSSNNGIKPLSSNVVMNDEKTVGTNVTASLAHNLVASFKLKKGKTDKKKKGGKKNNKGMTLP